MSSEKQGSSDKKKVNDWIKLTETNPALKVLMDKLIMDYFVKAGFKEAAEKFHEEAGVDPPIDLSTMTNREKIRNEIADGNIGGAIGMVNELYPELFDNNRQLFYQLQVLPLIELIRKNDVEGAIKFGKNLVEEAGSTNGAVMNDLECAMALLAFDDPISSPFGFMMLPSYRQKLAEGVNAAIIKEEHGDTSLPKLTHLMKLIKWAEDELDKKNVKFPHLIDFATGTFDPPK